MFLLQEGAELREGVPPRVRQDQQSRQRLSNFRFPDHFRKKLSRPQIIFFQLKTADPVIPWIIFVYYLKKSLFSHSKTDHVSSIHTFSILFNFNQLSTMNQNFVLNTPRMESLLKIFMTS